MLMKIAMKIDGDQCINRICVQTNISQELKDKMLAIYENSIEKKSAFAIASFAIMTEENVGKVEEGLVDNVIDGMLRDFGVTPDEYDSAKYEQDKIKALEK